MLKEPRLTQVSRELLLLGPGTNSITYFDAIGLEHLFPHHLNCLMLHLHSSSSSSSSLATINSFNLTALIMPCPKVIKAG
jgi:hypothetical protein